jgi:plastocyanin
MLRGLIKLVRIAQLPSLYTESNCFFCAREDVMKFKNCLTTIGLLLLGAAGVAQGATTVTVTATASNTFSPSVVNINAGDSVTFKFGAGAPHNVVADDGSFRCAKGCDGDGAGGNGNVSTGWSFTKTFTNAATIKYFCEAHGGPNGAGMAGSVIVHAVTTPPPATIPLGGYLSGNWFNPSQGGHGFQLEFTNHTTGTTTADMVAIWFVYTPTGSNASDGSGQNWIYSEGDYDTTKSTVTLPALLLSGAKFPPNFNPADVRRISNDASTTWGTITFSFTDCNNGTVSWHSTVPGYNNANDTPLAIQRLTQIAGTTCPAQ